MNIKIISINNRGVMGFLLNIYDETFRENCPYHMETSPYAKLQNWLLYYRDYFTKGSIIDV